MASNTIEIRFMSNTRKFAIGITNNYKYLSSKAMFNVDFTITIKIIVSTISFKITTLKLEF